MRPMEGMRVIALEHAVAAPLCTRHLADLGADVIKIERPGEGDFARAYDDFVHGLSSHFVWLNRGKRSVTLDIKNADAREALDRLIAGADVLVQNLAPGAAARLGLTYEALQPLNPGLVVCDISGYGESGPFVHKKAYDLLIQAEAGLIAVTGPEDEPSRVGISAADIATGMYALTGILSAVLRRARTGQGANVKIAMLDAVAEWTTWTQYRHAYFGSPPPRASTTHPSIAPYGAHRTKDGQVILGLQNEREWAVFCEKVLGDRRYIDDPRFITPAARRENRAELTAAIEAVFADKTSAEAAALLDRAGIANGRLNQPIDVWNHEQLSARDRWREIGTAAGPVRAMLPPVTFTDQEAVMGDVPTVGQHTETLLREVGFDPERIARMRKAKAI